MATDADVPGQSIYVDVYIRQSGTQITAKRLTCRASDGHFAGYVTDLAPGTYDVQVYALNMGAGDSNPSIGYQSGVTVLNNKSTQPTGNIEAVNGENGSIYLQGWAFDPDSPDWSEMAIYVWVDGTSIEPAPLANVSRTDVNAEKGLTGSHGFRAYIPVAPGSHKVDIYFQNDSGSDNPHVYSQNITVSDPYAITYNVNGGSGSVASQDKRTGINLTLASSGFTRTGYTLDGWATSAGGDKAYDLGATYTGNAALSLYAHWTQNTATLTDGDDLSALSEWAGKTCTVTYTRSFTAGKPSTVCLPFAYTPKGEEKFYSFTGINEDDGNYTADMTEVVSPLVANTPYLFMPTGNADFSGTYAIPSIEAGSTTSGDWTFKGTYSTIEWTLAPAEPTYGFSAQDANAGIQQGQFVKVGSYVRIKPMRAYLQYNGSDSQFINARSLTRASATTSDDTLPETIGVRLISANGEVTAIGTLHTRTGEVTLDGWYTLDGKRLSTQPTQKGIYVNNGKKVVIK